MVPGFGCYHDGNPYSLYTYNSQIKSNLIVFLNVCNNTSWYWGLLYDAIADPLHHCRIQYTSYTSLTLSKGFVFVNYFSAYPSHISTAVKIITHHWLIHDTSLLVSTVPINDYHKMCSIFTYLTKSKRVVY